MKTLILPDIHHRTHIADAIYNHVKPDNVVCLGDYMDDFGDGPVQAKATATWMRDKINAGWTLLFGNHDLPYFVPSSAFICPGFSKSKYNAAYMMSTEYWGQMRFWTFVGPWLLSHAGLSEHWAHPIHGLDKDYLTELERTISWEVSSGMEPAIVAACGRSRGGGDLFPGCLWQDWYEFVPVRGVSQIVGHTPHLSPQLRIGKNSINIGLDTHLNHYAVIEHSDWSITIYNAINHVVHSAAAGPL